MFCDCLDFLPGCVNMGVSENQGALVESLDSMARIRRTPTKRTSKFIETTIYVGIYLHTHAHGHVACFGSYVPTIPPLRLVAVEAAEAAKESQRPQEEAEAAGGLGGL